MRLQAVRLALAALGVAAAAHLTSPRAFADAAPADPLAAARALFAEALADEDAGRFADALHKFERVRAVRDTAPIEYRIGTCDEGLGQPAAAYTAYQKAVTLGQGNASSADVVQASQARLDALGPQVAPVPGSDAPVPIAVPSAPPPAPEHPRWSPVTGWVLVAGGATLVAASVVLAVVRHEDIAALDRDCPGGACPPGSDRADLESTRSRALVEGPLALGLGLAGAAAVAVGAVLVVRANRARDPASRLGVLEFAPAIGGGSGGVLIRGTWR